MDVCKTILVMTLLIFCLGNALAHAPPSQIKVGIIPVIGYLPTFVAQDKGYFLQEGLDVGIECLRQPA